MMPALLAQIKNIPPIPLPVRTQVQLAELFEDVHRLGGWIELNGSLQELRYALVTGTTAQMRIAQADVFAPVLSIFQVPDADAAIAAHAHAPSRSLRPSSGRSTLHKPWPRGSGWVRC